MWIVLRDLFPEWQTILREREKLKSVDSCSKKNLENKDTSEISAKQAIDAKQSTDAEIPKSETEGN